MANSFKNYVINSIGIDDTAVLTATSVATTIIGLSLANITSEFIAASVRLNKFGSSEVYVVKDAPIPPGSSLVVFGKDEKLILQTGDILVASSNTYSAMDALLSTLEIN